MSIPINYSYCIIIYFIWGICQENNGLYRTLLGEVSNASKISYSFMLFFVTFGLSTYIMSILIIE